MDRCSTKDGNVHYTDGFKLLCGLHRLDSVDVSKKDAATPVTCRKCSRVFKQKNA